MAIVRVVCCGYRNLLRDLGWYAASALKEQAFRDAADTLESQALILAELLKRDIEEGKTGQAKQFYQTMSASLKSRITTTAADGRVIDDSHEDPSRMDNHAFRPEVKKALAGDIGVSQRYSDTVNAMMVYVAVPVMQGGRLVGSVRVSRPVGLVLGSLASIYLGLLVAALAAIVVAALPTVYFSFRIRKLVRQLEEAATRFADGDLSGQIELPVWREFTGLATAINRMAEQMRERLDALTRRKLELEAVLGSMVEAVLMVDNEERLINMNQAAIALFRPRQTEFAGRNFLEVIRNTDLQSFVKRAAASDVPVEEDIVIIGPTDTHLQAHGTALRHADGHRMGTLIVLNNITRLKNLEQIRKDLVSNASHELRTPVTSIKGFLETLRDGALDDPEAARRFVDIMIRQSNRLTSIIEDMLTLSEIEKAPQKGSLRVERVELSAILQAVHKEFTPIAQEKQIDLQVQCQPGLTAMINEQLFHQALVNLVDNAIKYTGTGGKVEIHCRREGDATSVCVEDNGIGIPREHLSRIFERFYRVDAGRSRKMGGTGLGLAIVKHIAAAHGGNVTVQSSPGVGSKFCIHLPTDARAHDLF